MPDHTHPISRRTFMDMLPPRMMALKEETENVLMSGDTGPHNREDMEETLENIESVIEHDREFRRSMMGRGMGPGMMGRGRGMGMSGMGGMRPGMGRGMYSGMMPGMARPYGYGHPRGPMPYGPSPAAFGASPGRRSPDFGPRPYSGYSGMPGGMPYGYGPFGAGRRPWSRSPPGYEHSFRPGFPPDFGPDFRPGTPPQYPRHSSGYPNPPERDPCLEPGPDLYAVLELSKSATQEEIEKQGRKLKAKWHPDRNKEEGAEEKFKLANEAAEWLGDVKKRRFYDETGLASAGTFEAWERGMFGS